MTFALTKVNQKVMKKLLPVFFLSLALYTQAQTTVDSMADRVTKLEKVQIFTEFSLSVYAQVQYQRADTAGIRSFEGGDFPVNSNNRLMIRRGRIKLSYDHSGRKGFRVFQTVVQVDITERGFMPRDFWGRIIEPWSGWVGLQAGLMDRPFGFEVIASDEFRESPERARLSQIIFPGEKDLGASLVIESPKTFKPLYLRWDAGVFNGTGVGSVTFSPRKDIITHIQARKYFALNPTTSFTLSGGASYYNGWVMQQSPYIYNLGNDGLGHFIYLRSIDSAGIAHHFEKREYYGLDLQGSIDYKIGTTTIRGEFIGGRQPGTALNYNAPVTITNPGTDLYIRHFNGFYAYFVQTFKQKIKDQTIYHDLIFKYDLFEPNIHERGRNISLANDANVTATDIKYQTLGVGYTIRPCEWARLMVYYAIVKNEKTGLPGFTGDLHDNVLTVRMQFGFNTDWFKKK